MDLTGKQRRVLRARAQRLKPLVIVGEAGVGDSVLEEIRRCLAHHQLIKVRVNAADRVQREALIERIRTATDAELIARIGHVATLFRANPQRPPIPLG